MSERRYHVVLRSTGGIVSKSLAQETRVSAGGAEAIVRLGAARAWAATSWWAPVGGTYVAAELTAAEAAQVIALVQGWFDEIDLVAVLVTP